MISQTKQSGVEGLEPRAVWGFFAGIAATPRPSKREQKIRRHIQQVAGEHGLTCREDGVGNLVIEVGATAGREQAPITVLQAHLDMVCEKNGDVSHDFDNEPIALLVEKNGAEGEVVVCANGTTLGADNGIGVAMALAAATSPEVVHGPLELLFTVDEEAGMTGAKALTPESFRGRIMLNLDSEEDERIYIGCAGGCDTNLTWNMDATPVPQSASMFATISLTGLRGGHSGCDIYDGRGNAIKLIARTLLRTRCAALWLMTISGGSKRNAIPREASATIAGPPDMLDLLTKTAKQVCEEAKQESGEQDVVCHVTESALGDEHLALSVADTARVLSALAALPSGIVGMHRDVAGLVETSNNVSTIAGTLANGRITVEIGTLTRSSSPSRMAETLAQIASIGQLAGATVATGNEYPGWEPEESSPTLAVCRRIYENLFHAPPEVTAIHAGLECGIIGQRVGEMDMVSFGPRIEGAHSPDERVYVASVGKSWRYLVAVLGELARV